MRPIRRDAAKPRRRRGRRSTCGHWRSGRSCALLREYQLLAKTHAVSLLEHGMTQRDDGDAEAAMPEQDGLAVALAARLRSRDDLAELAVQRPLGELAGFDMSPERAERAL